MKLITEKDTFLSMHKESVRSGLYEHLVHKQFFNINNLE